MFKAVGIGLLGVVLSNQVICEIVVSTGIVLSMLKVKIGYQLAISATVIFIIATMIKAML